MKAKDLETLLNTKSGFLYSLGEDKKVIFKFPADEIKEIDGNYGISLGDLNKIIAKKYDKALKLRKKAKSKKLKPIDAQRLAFFEYYNRLLLEAHYSFEKKGILDVNDFGRRVIPHDGKYYYLLNSDYSQSEPWEIADLKSEPKEKGYFEELYEGIKTKFENFRQKHPVAAKVVAAAPAFIGALLVATAGAHNAAEESVKDAKKPVLKANIGEPDYSVDDFYFASDAYFDETFDENYYPTLQNTLENRSIHVEFVNSTIDFPMLNDRPRPHLRLTPVQGSTFFYGNSDIIDLVIYKEGDYVYLIDENRGEMKAVNISGSFYNGGIGSLDMEQDSSASFYFNIDSGDFNLLIDRWGNSRYFQLEESESNILKTGLNEYNITLTSLDWDSAVLNVNGMNYTVHEFDTVEVSECLSLFIDGLYGSRLDIESVLNQDVLLKYPLNGSEISNLSQIIYGNDNVLPSNQQIINDTLMRIVKNNEDLNLTFPLSDKGINWFDLSQQMSGKEVITRVMIYNEKEISTLDIYLENGTHNISLMHFENLHSDGGWWDDIIVQKGTNIENLSGEYTQTVYYEDRAGNRMIATQKVFVEKTPLNYNTLSFTVEDQTGILSGPLNTDEQQNVSLLDASWNILQNKTFTPVNGQAYVTFEMDNYSKGTYYLLFENKIRQIDLQGMVFDGVFLQPEDTVFLEDYKINLLNLSEADREAEFRVTNLKTGEIANITLPELNGPWSILYNNAVNTLGIDLAVSYVDDDGVDLIIGKKGNVTNGQKVLFDGNELSFVDILNSRLIYKDSQQEYRILDLTQDVVAYSPGPDFYVHSHFISQTEAVLEIDVPRDLRDDYADGYSDGYIDGIDDGTEIGVQDGYEDGYDDGYYTGNLDGYLDGFNASTDKILNLTEQLGAANSEINNLEEDLQEAQDENAGLQNDLENATDEIDRLEDINDDLENALNDANDTASEQEKDKDKLERKYLLYRNLFYTSCGGTIIAAAAFGIYTYSSRHEVKRAKDSLDEHVLTAKDIEEHETGKAGAILPTTDDKHYEAVDADRTLKGYEKDEVDLVMEKSINLKEGPKRKVKKAAKREPQDYTSKELTTGRTDEFPELAELYKETGNGVDAKQIHLDLIADSEMPSAETDPLYANWKSFPGCKKPTNKSYKYLTKKYNTPQELEEDYRLNPEGALDYIKGIKSAKIKDKVIKHLEDLN